MASEKLCTQNGDKHCGLTPIGIEKSNLFHNFEVEIKIVQRLFWKFPITALMIKELYGL